MRIVATEQLGELGAGESAPAVFQWHWYYQAPSLTLWLLTCGLVVLLQGNRKWRAIPVALTIAVFLLEGLGILFGSLVAVWIIVWLAGRWLPGRHGVAGDLTAVPSFGSDWGN